MKLTKIIISIIGSLLFIPLIIVSMGLIGYVLTLIFAIGFLHVIGDIVLFTVYLIAIIAVAIDGYNFTTKFLEKHFNCFKKDKDIK